MRCVVWSGLAAVLLAGAGRPVAVTRQPLPEAPAPVPVETFAGKTPREHSPAYQKALEADRAFAVVDLALERVWELPDPRDALSELIRVATEVDPVRTCDRVREVGVRLQKMKLPPARHVVWASFARATAPQDRDLRDALLRVAVAQARRALADAELWKPDPVPPGAVPLSDPQRLRDFEKQSLEYHVRLWQAVLEQRIDRARAIELTNALLADAKAKGSCNLGCISGNYHYDLLQALTSLDADLFFATVPKEWSKKGLAEYCASRAYSRWLDRQKDAFTGLLVKYAVENGAPSGDTIRGDVIRIAARYDFQRVWELVTAKGTPGSLITDLAWRDLDAALAVAEKEPDEATRRRLIDLVSRVWAYKKPDQIERALKNQDNAVRRDYARELAAAELEWRKQGNPPRDTPETAPRLGHPMPAKPAGTPWVPPADVQKLLEDPTRAAEADGKLHQMAPHMGQWAPADHAVEFVKRIKSPHLAANAAVWVARGLIRRAEVD
jgi:hypothetical protein